MPKRWVVISIVLVCLLMVTALAYLTEYYLSRAVAGIVGTLGIGLVGWILYSLYGSQTIFWGGKDTNDGRVQRYLRWLIAETDYRLMDGAGQATRDKDPEIFDLFCDLSSYGINERRLSLSSLLSETTVGREAYGAFLLGSPGSGKSVTLRAVLLSCANSSFLYNSLLGKLLGHRRTRDSSQWLRSIHKRFSWLFDPTWIIPTFPFVPILVDLRATEHSFEKYLETDRRDMQRDLLEPILENCGGLELHQFQALLRAGRIALLCDGVDELRTQELRLAALGFVRDIFAMGKPSHNLFLVTCRSGSFNDLRDAKPRDFKEVTLETLLTEDKRMIVRKLLLLELPRHSKNSKELILGSTARPEVRRMRANVGSFKHLHSALIKDLVEEIITRVPKGFPTWQPSDYPLSLRRMTSVLVPRQPKDIRLSWESGDQRPQWKLEIGALSESMGEYTKIIEQDLLEFLHRRKQFAECNDYSDNQMLLLYGELAYNYPSSSHTFTRDELRGFVGRKAKTKELTDEQQIDAFRAPGILTEVGGNGSLERFAFRDDESSSLVTALYMLDRDAAERIDCYISHQASTSDPSMALLMAFSKLRGEALTSFVQNSKYLNDPSVLQAVVLGGVGTLPHGILSKDEADAFLERCLSEVQVQSENERTLALWVAIRHIVFKQWCSAGWVPERFLKLLSAANLPTQNRAQVILVLAELASSFDKELNRDKVAAEINGWAESEDLLVRGCAALAMSYLLPNRTEFDLEGDHLSIVVPGGTYYIGDELFDLNPSDDQELAPFRIARFPVLRFQFNRWQSSATAPIERGDAFKPVVAVHPTDALAYALSKGARLPTAAEFEVAAAYSGTTTRRVYPWGDEFGPAVDDVVFERRNLREIFGDKEEALPVGLKPALATPSGIYDLVSNVWQLTSDRPPKVLREPEVLVFGPTISCNRPLRFRCFTRAPLAADRGHGGVGFRLAWNVRAGEAGE